MLKYDIPSAAYYCAAQKIFGMRPSVGLAVIDYCGGVQNLFSLSHSELKGLSRLIPECHKISFELVESSYEELSHFMTDGIKFISCKDCDYPKMLLDINDYPIGVYVKAKDNLAVLLNDAKLYGIIGGKTTSTYGKKTCEMVIDMISEKRSDSGIITRLTSGIDSTVNNIAKLKGITSIGVIPYGFSKNPNSRQSYDPSIIITDIPPCEGVTHLTILRRDRIISALSQAIILIESNDNNMCSQVIETSFSYGKEIWTFPGPVDWECYKYNNKLIRRNFAEIISSQEDLREKIKRL